MSFLKRLVGKVADPLKRLVGKVSHYNQVAKRFVGKLFGSNPMLKDIVDKAISSLPLVSEAKSMYDIFDKGLTTASEFLKSPIARTGQYLTGIG